MQIDIFESHNQMVMEAAEAVARSLREAIEENGEARIVFSTGASQLDMLDVLVLLDVDWKKVEAFHLDEYLGIRPDHPASFVKYLRERVESKVDLKAFHYVDISLGPDEIIDHLTSVINEKPVDIGLIGIGENAHIAFNDPPADFEDQASFKVVELDDMCRRQQLGEGWFPTLDDVPHTAITMTVTQILKCRRIVSVVPFAVKAKAVHDTLSYDGTTPMIPATILKRHPDSRIFLDGESAALLSDEILKKSGLSFIKH